MAVGRVALKPARVLEGGRERGREGVLCCVVCEGGEGREGEGWKGKKEWLTSSCDNKAKLMRGSSSSSSACHNGILSLVFNFLKI